MITGIVGLGLMGASLARTLKKKGERVYGTDIDPTALETAIRENIVDGALDQESLGLVDILIVSVFPESFDEATRKVLPMLKKGAIVCDFCGIKRKITDQMELMAREFTDISFFGGHPMAGREVSGISGSRDDLFASASMILVPVSGEKETLSRVKEYFLGVDFERVVVTDSDNHDAMIAYTSQLCHIVSNAFIKNGTAQKHFGYSAGSYKDMTRVARLNPEMWSQLMTANADKLLPELDELIENLKKYSDTLKSGDRDGLKLLLTEGNKTKLKIDEEE